MNDIMKLGSYEFGKSGYSMYEHDIYVDYTDVEIHERAHLSVATRTTLDTLCSLLANNKYIASALNNEEKKLLISYITNRSEEIFEGVALFKEYLTKFNKLEKQKYLESCQSWNWTYKNGFRVANQIVKILDDVALTEFPILFRDMIRDAALVDIARFVLNIPVFSFIHENENNILLSNFISYLEQNDPLRRWKYIFTKLLGNKEISTIFVEKSLPMFRTWVEKDCREKNIDGYYSGIAYIDNIEPVLSEVFPELKWQPFDSELSKTQLFQYSNKPEEFGAFLRRTNAGNLVFIPTLRIDELEENGVQTLMMVLNLCNKGRNRGSYIKIFISAKGHKRTIDLGPNNDPITLISEQALILIHLAVLHQRNDGRTAWKYLDHLLACKIKLNLLRKMIENIDTDFCGLVFDVDLDQPNALDIFFSNQEWECLPIFITSHDTGSLESFLKLCNFVKVRNYTLDVFPISSDDSFIGINNKSIESVWAIPDFGLRAMALFNLGTSLLLTSVIQFIQIDKNDKFNLGLKKGGQVIFDQKTIDTSNKNINPIIVNPDPHKYWCKDESDIKIIHAPQNGNIVINHMITYQI